MAAALRFERLLGLIIKYIIGWDERDKKPLKMGGFFGIPEAWLRVVQEQSRFTLHAHFEIWIVGHDDLANQFLSSVSDTMKSNSEMMSNFLSAITSLNASYDDNIPLDIVREEIDVRSRSDSAQSVANQASEEISFSDSSVQVVKVSRRTEKCLSRLKQNVEKFIMSELDLPAEEMNLLLCCPVASCSGKLHVKSSKCLEIQRRKPRIGDVELNLLVCSECYVTTSETDQLAKMLDHGFQRCFNRCRLTDAEVTTIIWKGLPPEPLLELSVLEHDRWLLNLAAIHLSVNLHGWKHRSSCFKNGRKECRYKLPKDECPQTVVCLIRKINQKYSEDLSSCGGKSFSSSSPVQLLIQTRKQAPFIFLTDCNRHILEVLRCNNCVRYVENQKVSMYCAGYITKYCTENEKSTAEVIRCLTKYFEKIKKQEDKKKTLNV